MLEGVDVRQLRALAAVADEGTFLDAADVLHLTQSAVSQQISKLEKAIGHPVFDRPGGPRHVKLTPIGAVVLKRARAIIAQLELGSQEIDAFVNGSGGTLRCGSFQSISVHFLPAIITELIQESPGLEITISEESYNEDLIRGLLDGELDVAFHSRTTEHPGIESIRLGTDPFVAMLPKNSPLTPKSKRGSVSLEALGSTPLIGEFEDQDVSLIENSMRAHGIKPKYSFRSSDNGSVQALVRAGLGPAIMPSLTIDTNDPGVEVWPIAPAIEPRTLSVALPKGNSRTPAAVRFTQIAKKIGRDRLQRNRVTARA